MKLWYACADSPIGRLLIIESDQGVLRLAFENEDFDEIFEQVGCATGAEFGESEARLAPAITQLSEYFTGARRHFDLPLDWSLTSGFRAEVQQFLPTIEYGNTATYAEVAHAVGNPKAVRAVGSACATNPLPIFVPCHRVLRSDGGVGGYLGGPESKKYLLGLEKGR